MLFSQFEVSAQKILEQQNNLSKNSQSLSFLSPYDIISSYLNRQTLQNDQPYTKQFNLFQSPKPQKDQPFSAVKQVSQEHNLFNPDDRISTIKNKNEHGKVLNGLDSSDYLVFYWLSNAQVKHTTNIAKLNQQRKSQNHLLYGKQNNSERCYKPISQFYFNTNEQKVRQLKDIKQLPTKNKIKIPRKGILLSLARKPLR